MATPNPYTGTSVVDYLKSTGGASDFASRSNLATQKGIQGYTGTSEQNTQLLGSLRGTSPTIAPGQINTPLNQPPVPEPRPNGTATDKFVPEPTPTEPTTPTTEPQTLRQQMESKLTGMLGTPQATRADIKTEVGFDAKQKRAQQLESQIQRLTDVREREIAALEKNPEGVFGGALSSQVNKRIQDANKEIAKLNVEYKAANNDYIGAQQAVQDRLKDIQDQKNYDLQVFTTVSSFLQNDLTDSEKLQMAHNQQMSQIGYQAKMDREQKEYEYGLETGDFSGNYPGAGQVATSTGNYDLTGKTDAYGPYATDPEYANKVQVIYDKYKQTVSSPETADAVIKSRAPGSKITGKMVYDVANANGIDPLIFMAQLTQENNFGTTGAALKNTNFGGVKYVGQANAKQGTLSPEGDYYANFNTVEDALNTQAQEVARRKVEGGTTTGAITPNDYKNALANASMNLPANQRVENTRRLNQYLKEGNEKGAKELIIRTAFAGQTGTQKEDTIKRQNAIEALGTIQSELNAYVKESGDTNILKGSMQEIAQKLGTAGDPRAAAVGAKVTLALQQYRNAVTGAAWGEQETAEYNKIFPDFKNTNKLNTALIDSMKESMNAFQEGTLSAYIGSDTYQKIFKDNAVTQPLAQQVQVSPEKQSIFEETVGSTERGLSKYNEDGTRKGLFFDVMRLLGINK